MARDFDDFPYYDPVLKPDTDRLSEIWRDSLATFFQTLIEYMNQYGIFVPRLTTDQRNTIQSPINGQMIYNTTLEKFQGFENGSWVNMI